MKSFEKPLVYRVSTRKTAKTLTKTVAMCCTVCSTGQCSFPNRTSLGSKTEPGRLPVQPSKVADYAGSLAGSAAVSPLKPTTTTTLLPWMSIGFAMTATVKSIDGSMQSYGLKLKPLF